MTARPSLTSSIPFWGLVAASVASGAVGAWIVVDKTATIETALVNGTQTGVEIYAGQPLVLLGAFLVAVGVAGILLALAIAAVASLRPTAPVDVIEIDESYDLYDSETEGVDAAAPTETAVDAVPQEGSTTTR